MNRTILKKSIRLRRRNLKQNVNSRTKCLNEIQWNFSSLACYLHSVCVFVFDQVKLVLRISRFISCRRRVFAYSSYFGKCARLSFCFKCKYSLESMVYATVSTKCTRQHQKHARQATKKLSIEFSVCMYIVCTGNLGKNNGL